MYVVLLSSKKGGNVLRIKPIITEEVIYTRYVKRKVGI